MDYYNETIATTTDFDSTGTMTGYHVKETSYPIISIIVFFIVVLSPLFFYRLFRRK